MPHWQRTLYAVWFAEFVAIVGLSYIQPFLPFYIQELGVTDFRDVALWSGLASSVTSVALAVTGPVWGILSDRHGRKVMVMRATYAGALVLALISLVTSVEQLVALRLVQGLFTGTIAAATMLVAGVVPRERAGMALGALQTAVFLGSSLGPVVGGVLSDNFGYRNAFLYMAPLLFVSGLMVTFFVHEEVRPAQSKQTGGMSGAIQFLLASGGVLLWLFVARTLLRAGTQVPSQAMPLLVQTLLGTQEGAASYTGLIVGASAVGAAVGSPVIGGWGDRYGHRRMLIISGIGSAVLFIPQAFAPSPAFLIPFQLVGGFFIGGTLSTLSGMLVNLMPEGRAGMVFGLDSSAASIANAAGIMGGAAIAGLVGVQLPFIAAAVIVLLGTVVVIAQLRETPAGPDTPRVAWRVPWVSRLRSLAHRASGEHDRSRWS